MLGFNCLSQCPGQSRHGKRRTISVSFIAIDPEPSASSIQYLNKTEMLKLPLPSTSSVEHGPLERNDWGSIKEVMSGKVRTLNNMMAILPQDPKTQIHKNKALF